MNDLWIAILFFVIGFVVFRWLEYMIGGKR